MAEIHLQKLSDKVINRLEALPATRDSDITLMIEIWKKFYPKSVEGGKVFLEDLYNLPNHESIKRIRALIQNDKNNPRYLPNSWEVAEKRGINQAVWEAFIAKQKQENKTANQSTLFDDSVGRNDKNNIRFWR